jgi:hypothetical protein
MYTEAINYGGGFLVRKENSNSKVLLLSKILLILPAFLLLVIGMSGEEGPIGEGSVLHAFLTSDVTDQVMELRFRGSILLGMVIFGIGIIFNSYSKGERWAWVVMWFWPVFFALHIYSFKTWIPDLPLLLLTSFALVVSYKSFFKSKSASKTEDEKIVG